MAFDYSLLKRSSSLTSLKLFFLAIALTSILWYLQLYVP
jgi:hypothetical protein